MMRERLLTKFTSRAILLLFLLVLFLYTMAFPASTSWFILLFFLIVFLGLYLTTRFHWGASRATLMEAPDGSKDVHLHLQTRGWLPILLPEVTLRLALKTGYAEVEVPLYFRNSITPVFRNIQLPRGRHEQLNLETYGRDYFGFFSHYSRHSIPARIDIYPEMLTEQERHRYLRKVTATPQFRAFLHSSSAQFRQLREHGPRDELKHVDWKTSAKKQKLMVKEYEREALPSLTVSFWGLADTQFEKLLQVTYNLIRDVDSSLQLQILLVGLYGNETEVHTDELSFLTIQPSQALEDLLQQWQALKVANGYHIAIMPRAFQERLKESRPEPTLFLTELIFEEYGVNEWR